MKLSFKLSFIVSVILLFSNISKAQSDNCSPATTYATLCIPVAGSNMGATTGPEDSYAAADICALTVENTVWYTFTASIADTYTFTFDVGACLTGFGLQTGVLTGPCGGPYTSLNCSYAAASAVTSYTALLAAGQQVWIVVDGDGGDQCPFDFDICGSTCTADAGTISVLENSVAASSPIFLCPDGLNCVDLVSNNDFVLPPAQPGETAELMYALYTCPPTTGDPATDPCYSGSLWPDKDFVDCNPSTFGLTGTFYFVPITADDGDGGGDPNGVIAYDQNGDGCFDLGAVTQISYLSAITNISVIDSCAGVVSVTISGGAPAEPNGGNYTIVNEGAGVLMGAPISSGGAVSISGLVDGEVWNISVTDIGGCDPVVITGTYLENTDNPSWTNPTPICESDGSIDLNTLITGTAGGSWSGTGVSGSIFNPAGLSGAIDITYSVGTCPRILVQSITVISDVDPSWTNPTPICESDGSIDLNTLITGTAGGSWSGTGVSGSIFNPAGLSGAIDITYSVGTCPRILVQSITVISDVDPSWTNPTPICESDGSIDLNTLITGTAGGSWSGTGVSGSIFNPAGLSGAIDITYSVGTCPRILVQSITVISDVDPSWTNPSPICENGGSINLNTLITGTGGGSWSGTGVSGTTFNPSGLSGPIDITYTVGVPPCEASLTLAINVVDIGAVTFTAPADLCIDEGLQNGLGGGTPTGGVYSGTGVMDDENGMTYSFDPAVAEVGTHMITYTFTDNNGCSDTAVDGIEVFPITSCATPLEIASNNQIVFTDPCNCIDERNCVIDGVTYFHDTLIIFAMGVSGLDIRVVGNSVSGFYDKVECFGGTTSLISDGTLIPEQGNTGTYKIEFWRPSGVAPTLSVIESNVITPAQDSTFEPVCDQTSCRPIPTLGQWGLIILGILFLIFGIVYIQLKSYKRIVQIQ